MSCSTARPSQPLQFCASLYMPPRTWTTSPGATSCAAEPRVQSGVVFVTAVAARVSLQAPLRDCLSTQRSLAEQLTDNATRKANAHHSLKSRILVPIWRHVARSRRGGGQTPTRTSAQKASVLTLRRCPFIASRTPIWPQVAELAVSAAARGPQLGSAH